MPARHIALVPEFGMNPSELARVSAALQKQISRDLEPVWQVAATVDAFPTLEDLPSGYWPIILTYRALGSEAGIHVDRNGQPYALMEISPSWSVTASHICLEMVTDPFGNRTFPGPSPRADQGDVEFLGAICDPCEPVDFAYLVNDVLVSDFCTPAYWDSDPSNKGRRSFTGAIQTPYQVMPGGMLSWYDPATNNWWLRRLTEGVLTDLEIGAANTERGSVREFMGRHSPHLSGTKMSPEAYEARVGMRRQRSLQASQARAYWLRAAFGAHRGSEALEFDAEVRSAMGAMRGARDLLGDRQPSLNPSAVLRPAEEAGERRPVYGVPSHVASEVAVREAVPTVDEADLETEIKHVLERLQGQMRAKTSSPLRDAGAGTEPSGSPRHGPRPAPVPASETVPPPSPIAAAVSETPQPHRHAASMPRTVPPPLPEQPAPPASAPNQAFSPAPPLNTWPAGSVAPAAVSVAPVAAASHERGKDSRFVVVGGIAAAALVLAAVTALRGNGSPPASGAAAANPTLFAPPPPAVASLPPAVREPPPPSSTPAPSTVLAATATASAPWGAGASSEAGRPAHGAETTGTARTPRAGIPESAPTVPGPSPRSPRQPQSIDSLIDDRR